MRDIIIDLQKSDTWKIQLTIVINFISSKDVEEEPVMHSKNFNIKFAPFNNANEIVEKLFESLFSRYQNNLETLIRGNDLHYKCIKLKLDVVFQILILQTR